MSCGRHRKGNRGCRRLHPANNDCERRNFNVDNTFQDYDYWDTASSFDKFGDNTFDHQFHFESLRFRQVESTRSFDYDCCIKYSSTSPTLTAKLPKTVLPKFRGEVTNWLSFWDSFNSAVHVNPGLSKIDSTGSIGHFTVMDGSEGEGDLVLIQTLSALLWKLFLKNTS